MSNTRIYLSPPHMSGEEEKLVSEAFADNWIAPVGPHLTAFEREFGEYVGTPHTTALASGTAGLHLALQMIGVGVGDEVVVSDFTFIGSVSPILYLGATPVFIDSDRATWNMDADLLAEFLAQRAKINRLPKAVMVVHLYGQCADMDPILAVCEQYAIPVIEDAAEALGATYKGKHAGTLTPIGVFSFNGNKIITTSGGGMLVAQEAHYAERARHLATQAREPFPYYEHVEFGYNYRMSNILAAIGLGQMRILPERVERRREIFQFYQDNLSEFDGIDFMPEAEYGRANRWLSAITIDPERFGATYEQVRLGLEAENIESRPLWKPMHLQPLFHEREFVDGGVGAELFAKGLCLPSGTALTETDLTRIVEVIARHYQQ